MIPAAGPSLGLEDDVAHEPQDAERAVVVIAAATDVALGAVRDAKRQVDVLRIRRDAILDQQSTGYRRRSAHLPHLGESVRSVAAEMAALRSSRSN